MRVSANHPTEPLSTGIANGRYEGHNLPALVTERSARRGSEFTIDTDELLQLQRLT
jgi:hypothetical protein